MGPFPLVDVSTPQTAAPGAPGAMRRSPAFIENTTPGCERRVTQSCAANEGDATLMIRNHARILLSLMLPPSRDTEPIDLPWIPVVVDEHHLRQGVVGRPARVI